MDFRSEFTNFSQRLSDFTDRFDEQAQSQRKKGPQARKVGLLEAVISDLRDLFTRDVTREGLRDMLKRDTRDAFRYFTREIDFEALKPLPRHKRYPRIAWQIFTALAYRLSPPRRIAFAVAVLAFAMGLIQFMSFSVEKSESGQIFVRGQSGAFWWLIALVIFVFLLLLELRDKLDLKSDLSIAREIQFGLVPSQPFARDGIRIDCQMRPANTVGGDYFDILELGEPSHIGIVVGDVAGKGMPAALLMALLQGSLRTLITAGFRGPSLISKLNEYLYANIPSNSLVTFFYGELDTITGKLVYINAGHNAPYLVRASRDIERLHSNSLVLGIVNDSPFEEAWVELQPGDRLVLFTDGVTEAFNEHEEEYGEDRLMNLLKQRAQLPQREMIDQLIAEVLSFCGAARPADDMTIMVVARQTG